MTTYKDEKIEDAVAKKLSDKLEATQRVITVDRVVLTEALTGMDSNSKVSRIPR